MPSGKKRKRHKVATHKRKKDEDQIDIRKNSDCNHSKLPRSLKMKLKSFTGKS